MVLILRQAFCLYLIHKEIFMGQDNEVWVNKGTLYSGTGTFSLANVSGSSKGFTDSNGNEFPAVGASSFSTLTATNHNFAGGAVPTYAFCQENNGATAAATAAAMSLGTFTATQYTPAGTANACKVIAGVF